MFDASARDRSRARSSSDPFHFLLNFPWRAVRNLSPTALLVSCSGQTENSGDERQCLKRADHAIRLLETNGARVPKVPPFRAAEMIGKQGVTTACWSNGLNAKRAGKAKHSRRLLRRPRLTGRLLVTLGALLVGCAASQTSTAEPHSAAKYSASPKIPLEVPRKRRHTPDLTDGHPYVVFAGDGAGTGTRNTTTLPHAPSTALFELDPDRPPAVSPVRSGRDVRPRCGARSGTGSL